MHQTPYCKEKLLVVGNRSACQAVCLPAPAYYVTGLAVSLGLNWLSWKMAHSRRWHKPSPIPQLLAIGGNLCGFHSDNIGSLPRASECTSSLFFDGIPFFFIKISS
jgi:hypothetical protein